MKSVFGLVFVLAMTFPIGRSYADDAIRFMGGPAGNKMISTHLTELEKVAGSRIHLSNGLSDQAIFSLAKGLVDVSVIAEPIDASLRKAEKTKNLVGEKSENYEVVIFGHSVLKVALNPMNSVQNLTKEQIANILLGKTKNWSEVGGPDTKVKVFLAQSSVITATQVPKHYLGKDKVPVATIVADATGVVNMIKLNLGGMGFLSTEIKSVDFSPKLFNTDISRTFYLVAKKPLKPKIQLIFDSVKSAPPLELE